MFASLTILRRVTKLYRHASISNLVVAQCSDGGNSGAIFGFR
jgi:hypothetical protein